MLIRIAVIIFFKQIYQDFPMFDKLITTITRIFDKSRIDLSHSFLRSISEHKSDLKQYFNHFNVKHVLFSKHKVT